MADEHTTASANGSCGLERSSFGELQEPLELGGYFCCPTHQSILLPLAGRWPKLACPKGDAVWGWSHPDEAWL